MGTQVEPLKSPDPERPDLVFRCGDHDFEVQTLPALFPVTGLQGQPTAWDLGTTLLLIVYLLLGSILSRIFDRRWKVVVSRMSTRRGSLWRVIHVEFLPSEAAANLRRDQLLREWSPEQFSTSLPLSRSDIKRIRQSTR